MTSADLPASEALGEQNSTEVVFLEDDVDRQI